MITYLKHNEIDKQKWDACIQHAGNSIIYACSWYLDIVCSRWEALVENDYEAVFPLTVGKRKGFNYLFQPLVTQQLGVFSQQIPDQGKVKEFLQAIPDKFKLIDIQLNTFNKLESSDFEVVENTTFELALNCPYEELFKNYSQNCKRNIKKAEKAEIILNRNGSPEDIVELFKKTQGRTVVKVKQEDYMTLLRVISVCNEREKAEIWSAAFHDKLCAGIFFVKSNKKAIFLFSATNDVAKSNGVMPWMIDAFIREHAGTDLVLDFEGSNVPNLARFYKGFGAEKQVYLQLKKNDLPWGIRKSIDLIKKFKN